LLGSPVRFLTSIWGVSDDVVKKLPDKMTSITLIRVKADFLRYGIPEEEANTLDIIFSMIRDTKPSG
jgi:hypothetical protein